MSQRTQCPNHRITKESSDEWLISFQFIISLHDSCHIRYQSLCVQRSSSAKVRQSTYLNEWMNECMYQCLDAVHVRVNVDSFINRMNNEGDECMIRFTTKFRTFPHYIVRHCWPLDEMDFSVFVIQSYNYEIGVKYCSNCNLNHSWLRMSLHR